MLMPTMVRIKSPRVNPPTYTSNRFKILACLADLAVTRVARSHDP